MHRDICAVWLVNGTAVATIQLAQVRDIAAIILTVISVAFTIWRWRKEANRKD